jgi:hypothetical protein
LAKNSIVRAHDLYDFLMSLTVSVRAGEAVSTDGTAPICRMPSVPIIVFTLYIDSFVDEEAAHAGVSDLVSQSRHVSTLIAKARGFLYREAA